MKRRSKRRRDRRPRDLANRAFVVQTPSLKKWRLQLIRGALFLVGAIIFARLFQIQVLEREKYIELVERQGLDTVVVRGDRGLISDRNGTALVMNTLCYNVGVDKNSAQNIGLVSKGLASALGINRSAILKKIRKPGNFVWIDTKVEPGVKDAIARMDLAGVAAVESSRRVYPFGNHLAQVIGFTNLDGAGISGIELAWDEYLRGESRRIVVQRDALGRNVRPANYESQEIRGGMNLILTIDNIIQSIVEDELRATVAKHNAKGGSAIVTDPKTGEVLAMASLPGFNANEAANYAAETWRIRPITDIFEPGSTFKIVTMAATLTGGKKKLDDLIFGENGAFRLFGEEIHDTKKHAWLTVRTAFTKSSNICFAKLATEIGPGRLGLMAREFGFGNQTGIELPGEVSGTLKAQKDWSRFSVAAISYGYEVAVTPLQIAMAYGAIANGGQLLKPLIVKRIEDENGDQSESFAPQVIRRVLDERAAKTLAGLLEETVENGTGQGAGIQNLRIAGKTGTTQKALQGARGYSQSSYISSFAGFYPADNPKVLIFVTIDEPGPAYYGGEVAAPTFRNILQRILVMHDELKQERLPQPTGRTPRLAEANSEDFDGAKTRSQTTHVKVQAELATGRLQAGQAHRGGSDHQAPASHLRAGTARHEQVVRNRMPDLQGLSLRRALSELSLRGLSVRVVGSGRVARQEPKAGEVVKLRQRCILVCKPVVEIGTIHKVVAAKTNSF